MFLVYMRQECLGSIHGTDRRSMVGVVRSFASAWNLDPRITARQIDVPYDANFPTHRRHLLLVTVCSFEAVLGGIVPRPCASVLSFPPFLFSFALKVPREVVAFHATTLKTADVSENGKEKKERRSQPISSSTRTLVAVRLPLRWRHATPSHLDDAAAHLMTLGTGEFKILGVTSTFGNARIADTTRNALDLLQAYGHGEVFDYSL